jgi:hypothetical protein
MTSTVVRGLWRDASAYQSVVSGGRASLAWELLRRDPAYQADTDGSSDRAASLLAADPACVARWGLHFRG